MKHILCPLLTFFLLIFLHQVLYAQTSKTDEIKTATKAEPKFEEYGGTVGLGLAIGGGGLLGIPVRVYLKKKIAFEIGYYLRPVILQLYNSNLIVLYEYQTKIPPFIAGGVNFILGNKFNLNSTKIIKNGIMIKAGTTIMGRYKYDGTQGVFSQRMYAVGWSRERFKVGRKKSSYIFELGIGIMKSKGDVLAFGLIKDDFHCDDYQYGNCYDVKIDPLIFWKFHWNFFLK